MAKKQWCTKIDFPIFTVSPTQDSINKLSNATAWTPTLTPDNRPTRISNDERIASGQKKNRPAQALLPLKCERSG